MCVKKKKKIVKIYIYIFFLIKEVKIYFCNLGLYSSVKFFNPYKCVMFMYIGYIVSFEGNDRRLSKLVTKQRKVSYTIMREESNLSPILQKVHRTRWFPASETLEFVAPLFLLIVIILSQMVLWTPLSNSLRT